MNVRDGTLVLSRNTGAFEELRPWAIEIDPFDVEDQANALERALELPRETVTDAWRQSVNGYAGTISTRGRRPCWPRSSAPVRCADDPRAGRITFFRAFVAREAVVEEDNYKRPAA